MCTWVFQNGGALREMYVLRREEDPGEPLDIVVGLPAAQSHCSYVVPELRYEVYLHTDNFYSATVFRQWDVQISDYIT